ncbi:hypothetical protein ACFFWC_21780 [Plantactinospora siamensis]|uniref:Uncharacterized protein n=1 Tax=Plantactinospora siamensis TaxID=555372 RepID=A0ABV6P5I2_9ACTN
MVRAAFYGVVLLTALAGQVTGATQKLHIPLLAAIPAVGALELGGVVLMSNADVRRRLGERALASRVLSAAIAAGAVGFNWLAHDDHLLGGFFAGMSGLGYLVWLLHVDNQRRDRLRAVGALAAPTPAYELVGHWLRHPILTRRARSMARADARLGLYGSLDAAHAALRRERRDAAITKVLRRKIEAAVDPATARIAVHVYDLDEIAARLTATADYDGLTDLIAADLTPARIADGVDRRQGPRPDGHPRPTGQPGHATQPLTAHTARRRPKRAEPEPSPERDEDQRPPHGPTPSGPEPSQSFREDQTTSDDEVTDESHADATAPEQAEQTPGVPSETPAAVAYWLGINPDMGYDEIARRIGRTERTVRRNLPPGHRRRRGRDRT